jgi:hypothetical protein
MFGLLLVNTLAADYYPLQQEIALEMVTLGLTQADLGTLT